MKKLLSLLLVGALLLSLSACGESSEAISSEVSEAPKDVAFETSKEAYDCVTTAYEITEKFGSDVYEAWRMGIYDDDEIKEEGVGYLAKELNLSSDELTDGIAYILKKSDDVEWEDISEEEKEEARKTADIYFSLFDDEIFSACVYCVTGAYNVNGQIKEAQEALNQAKSLMKTMSQEYSDYEHYPALKEYFTTTSAFFGFCQNPMGSFEQVKDTINEYRNDARSHKNDLDFIFED